MGIGEFIRGTNETPPEKGGFVSRSSLLTYSGASLAVTVLYTFFGAIIQPGTSPARAIFALVCAAPVGAFLYLHSITATMTASEKQEAAFIAFLNTIVLASAALGLASVAANQAPPPLGQPASPAPVPSAT
jgi:hypothetical protein